MSLNARNGFSLAKGYEIWRGYNERLLALHERYKFPIFEFERDEGHMRDAVNRALKHVGLPQKTSQTFFDSAYIRQSASQCEELPPENVQELYMRLQNSARQIETE